MVAGRGHGYFLNIFFVQGIQYYLEETKYQFEGMKFYFLSNKILISREQNIYVSIT